MNLIDAIRLYCHVMQQAGCGLEARRAARDALLLQNVQLEVCDAVANAVGNNGHLTSGSGATFALTQIGGTT